MRIQDALRPRHGLTLAAGVAAAALAIAGCSSSGSGGGGGGGTQTTGNSSTSSSSTTSSTSSSSTSSSGSGQLIYGEPTEFSDNLMPLISAGNSTSTEDLEVRLLNGPYRVAPNITFIVDNDQVVGNPTSKLVNGQQVVTYHINPKAVWADGQPITSADYAFTWQDEKASDPKQGGCAALLSTTGYDQIQKVDATQKDTAVVTFKKGQSFPDWQALFSPLLSKHVFDQGSPTKNCDYIKTGWPAKNGIPLGAQNGPWVLQQNNIDTANKTFALSPNPKYWGAQPKLAHLILTYIGSDPDTNVKALQNNEVNMIYPQPQLDIVSKLKQLPNVTSEINFGVAFEHLDFNVKYGELSNKLVREAIAYGIDRPALVNATVGQFSDKASVLGNRMIMTNQKGYVDNSGPYAHQNMTKAKQLLAQAGAKMGSNGVMTLNGKPLAFQIMTTQDNPLRDSTIQTIASQLKPLGIKITENANADIFEGPDKPTSLAAHGFQIALFAWVGSPSISSNLSIYYNPATAKGGQNYSQGWTPQIDQALDKMSSSYNTSDEIKYANQADKLLWQQMYTLPLYQKPTQLAFDSNYTGIGDNPTQVGPLWNSETFAVKS